MTTIRLSIAPVALGIFLLTCAPQHAGAVSPAANCRQSTVSFLIAGGVNRKEDIGGKFEPILRFIAGSLADDEGLDRVDIQTAQYSATANPKDSDPRVPKYYVEAAVFLSVPQSRAGDVVARLKTDGYESPHIVQQPECGPTP